MCVYYYLIPAINRRVLKVSHNTLSTEIVGKTRKNQEKLNKKMKLNKIITCCILSIYDTL